jgi:hypothetical protein
VSSGIGNRGRGRPAGAGSRPAHPSPPRHPPHRGRRRRRRRPQRRCLGLTARPRRRLGQGEKGGEGGRPAPPPPLRPRPGRAGRHPWPPAAAAAPVPTPALLGCWRNSGAGEEPAAAAVRGRRFFGLHARVARASARLPEKNTTPAAVDAHGRRRCTHLHGACGACVICHPGGWCRRAAPPVAPGAPLPTQVCRPRRSPAAGTLWGGMPVSVAWADAAARRR